MFYTYVLIDQNKHIYVGSTKNLRKRFEQHIAGGVRSTKGYEDIQLYYYEAYSPEQLARQRETKLKQHGSVYQGLLKRIGLK